MFLSDSDISRTFIKILHEKKSIELNSRDSNLFHRGFTASPLISSYHEAQQQQQRITSAVAESGSRSTSTLVSRTRLLSLVTDSLVIS